MTKQERDNTNLIAEVSNPDLFRLDAYYYGFLSTGVIEIDRILSAVARAGKSFHHTEYWSDDDAVTLGYSYSDLIQAAANEAAKALGVRQVGKDD